MSERNKLLREIQQLNFQMIEAGLFLNNQPCCQEAQEAFQMYQREHRKAREEYEQRFGPLTYDGVDTARDGWSWVCGPWPWEGED